MEILSYPVGLLIGLFPIAVELGPSRAPAHLLLDSRPVCRITPRSPGCMVDLGTDPRVHLLELVRTDVSGHVTERVRRWINRPGIDPEVLVAGTCDDKGRQCAFEVSWAHPRKLDPRRVVLLLDGVTVYRGKERRVQVPLAKGAKPQVLVADAEFPDGTRATYTRTLFAFYPEEAQAALQAVPILPPPDAGSEERIAEALRDAGVPVRTVEQTEPDITFVLEPHAFDAIPGMVPKAPSVPGHHRLAIRSPTGGSQAVTSIKVVVPDEVLSAYTTTADRLRVPLSPMRRVRFADAVAAAGYELGGSPRPRAVVLVLGAEDRESISTFSAGQAQRYLSEVMVPLVVWRVGDAASPEWPEGRRLMTSEDLRAAFDALGADVSRQRIAWLEGTRDTRHIGRQLAPGIPLAGRNSAPRETVGETPAGPEGAPQLLSIGPDGGVVHALAAAGDGSLLYAGTHAGLFRSRDRGVRWESASVGLPPAPVRSLAVHRTKPEVVFAGTDAGLFSSADAGEHWRAGGVASAAQPIAALAIDGADPSLLYVGTSENGVFWSGDGGATLLATALDHGDVRALAVEPRERSLWAATGEGIFRSADRGWSWTRAATLPARALALLWSGGKLYAGTAGAGLFVSTDSGVSWRRTNLTGAFLTGLATDPAPPGAFLAASPDGVFSSTDGGASWKLARIGAVEAIIPLGSGTTLAAGFGGVSRGEAAGRRWAPSNGGLAAQVVHSVAAAGDSPSAVYAGTGSGVYRLDAGAGGWSPVAGASDASTYAVALGGEGASELLVGASGNIGRAFQNGASWSWFPTHSVFDLAVDPARPSVLYAGTRGAVLKSEDGGLGWRESSEGIVKTFALALALDARDPAVIYAGTAGSGVYRSANGARSWKPGGGDLARSIVRCLAVEPNAADTLHAGTDRGVFTSSDTGRTWRPGFDGLPRGPVYALLVDAASPLTVFAGTAAGLFMSIDGGRSWSPFPAARLPAAVTSLALDRSRDALVAGTLGAGVFVVPLR